MRVREILPYAAIFITTLGFIYLIGCTVSLSNNDKITDGEFVIGSATLTLAFGTIIMALNEITEGRFNRNQVKELAARDRAISNYPLLSQKIILELPSKQIHVHGIDESSLPHYKLLIKNYGKGPAINQDKIFYIFFKGENHIHQNQIRITGEHDIIAPDGERSIDMTIRSENDWNLGMETKYDNIWIRLLHKDIQRNECCNCTTYEYKPQISEKFGKTERHWYFSSYPEISSEECKKCVWLNMEGARARI